MFSGQFAPNNWQFCNGQVLPVNQYQALYSLIGNSYGGTPGQSFALPDLRGRVPVHPAYGATGRIPAGAPGQVGGTIAGTVTVPLPQHTHTATFTGTGGAPEQPHTLGVNVTVAVANTSTGTVSNPENNVPAVIKSGMTTYSAYVAPASATGTLGGVSATLTGSPGHPATGITGGTVAVAQQGVPNAQISVPTVPPYLGVNYIICMNGLYPQRP